MKCIAGAETPTQGTRHVLGTDITACIADRARPRRHEPEIPDHQRAAVADALRQHPAGAAGADPRCSAWSSRAPARALHDRVMGMLAQFRLADRAGDPAAALSHGQQQWLEIAMALAAQAETVAAGRANRRHEPGRTARHRRIAAADQDSMLARDRRARPRFHSRYLRPPDRARPGQRAGIGTVQEIQASNSVQEVYLRRA